MTTNPFGFCAEPRCNDEVQPELPPMKDMVKGFLGTMTDVVTGAIHGDGILVTEDVYNTRMATCTACEFFRKEDKRCTQCGCFMEAKTRLKNVECPIHKWGKDK
jgi:hypothetical protein